MVTWLQRISLKVIISQILRSLLMALFLLWLEALKGVVSVIVYDVITFVVRALPGLDFYWILLG
jgi:hypothetical protein